MRSASVLAKKPISPSTSARLRFAIGAPTTMSFCPEYRDSSDLERRQQRHEGRGAKLTAGTQHSRWRASWEKRTTLLLPGSSALLDAADPWASRGRGSARQLLLPVRQQLVEVLSLQVIPLPDRVIGILQRKLWQRRWPSVRKRRRTEPRDRSPECVATSHRRRCGES